MAAADRVLVIVIHKYDRTSISIDWKCCRNAISLLRLNSCLCIEQPQPRGAAKAYALANKQYQQGQVSTLSRTAAHTSPAQIADAMRGYKAAIEAGARGELASTCHYNYGVLARGLGMNEEAVQSYTDALKIEPDSQRVIPALSDAHARSSPQAFCTSTWLYIMVLLTRCIRCEARGNLCNLQRGMRRFEEAAQCYEADLYPFRALW